MKYGEDKVISQNQIYVDVTLDDQHADDEAAVFRLVESAAALLGWLEDSYVIESIAPTTKRPPPVFPQGSGSLLRFPELRRASLKKNQTDARKTPIGAAGAAPTAAQIVEAVRKAQGELETVPRPGPCGLLLHSRLFAMLVDLSPGGAPYLQHVEHLIDSSEIAGTSALDGSCRKPVCSAEFSSAWNHLPSTLSKRRGLLSRCLEEPWAKQACGSRRMSSSASSTKTPFIISCTDSWHRFVSHETESPYVSATRTH